MTLRSKNWEQNVDKHKRETVVLYFWITAGAQEFCFALISPWACLIHHELRFQLLKSSYLYVMLAAFKLVPFIHLL